MEENGPVIKVDNNEGILKVEVNDNSDSADPIQFLSSDIDDEEEENFDHDDQPENFCSFCEKQFTSSTSLEIHLQTIHTNISEIETKEETNLNEKSKRSYSILIRGSKDTDIQRMYSDYFEITSLGRVSVITKNGHQTTK